MSCIRVEVEPTITSTRGNSIIREANDFLQIPLSNIAFAQCYTLESPQEEEELSTLFHDKLHEVFCDPNDFNDVRDSLEEKFGTAASADLSWKPQNNVNLDAESAKTLLSLMDALEDNDDVQKVSSNVEIDDELMAQLSS